MATLTWPTSGRTCSTAPRTTPCRRSVATLRPPSSPPRRATTASTPAMRASSLARWSTCRCLCSRTRTSRAATEAPPTTSSVPSCRRSRGARQGAPHLRPVSSPAFGPKPYRDPSHPQACVTRHRYYIAGTLSSEAEPGASLLAHGPRSPPTSASPKPELQALAASAGRGFPRRRSSPPRIATAAAERRRSFSGCARARACRCPEVGSDGSGSACPQRGDRSRASEGSLRCSRAQLLLLAREESLSVPLDGSVEVGPRMCARDTLWERGRSSGRERGRYR